MAQAGRAPWLGECRHPFVSHRSAFVGQSPARSAKGTRLAAIGDYGEAGQTEADVAALIDRRGADAFVTTGDNSYPNGISHFVNGAGGKSLYPFKLRPVSGSLVRYNQDYGAQLINATAQCLNLSFFSCADVLIDSVTLRR